MNRKRQQGLEPSPETSTSRFRVEQATSAPLHHPDLRAEILVVSVLASAILDFQLRVSFVSIGSIEKFDNKAKAVAKVCKLNLSERTSGYSVFIVNLRFMVQILLAGFVFVEMDGRPRKFLYRRWNFVSSMSANRYIDHIHHEYSS